MKGRDIIKMIIDGDGLDKDYVIETSTTKKTKKKKYKNLEDMCTVYLHGDMIVLEVADPLQAMPFGLSDKYEKYAWDGHSVYCYQDKDEACSWCFEFGGGSSTLVSSSVERYRDKMFKVMNDFVNRDNIKLPSNLSHITWFGKVA